MSILSEVKAAWKEAVEQTSNPKPDFKRRDLTQKDRLDWFDAMDERERAVKPRTIQDVQALIRNRNPIRWRRLQGDYRWVRKEMKKLGLNPEDARYIL